MKINILLAAMPIIAFVSPCGNQAAAVERQYLKSGDCAMLLVKEATDSKGKLLTAMDIADGHCLRPSSVSGYFKKTAGECYPKCWSSNGSLFLEYTDSSTTICIAKASEGVSYGTSVSRNEFGIDGGIFFSPDSSKVAFYRKDERNVKQLPYLDIAKNGGAVRLIRYPMNSEPSEKISLCCYDLNKAVTTYMDVTEDFDDERYLTNVSWGPDNRTIYIQLLSRDQRHMKLNSYCAASGRKLETILEEVSESWVEPRYPLYFIKGQDELCIYTTDNRDGWKNLYLLDVAKKTVKRLANLDHSMEYTDNDGKNVYFQCPDDHSINNYLWKCGIKDGKLTCLTTEKGWHKIEMAEDCKSFTDVYEALGKAPESRLVGTDGKVKKVLKQAEDPSSVYACGEISIGCLPTADGSDINHFRMVKPLDFDPEKKYPLIFYVYGGPGLSLVRNDFLGGLRIWEMYMAQKGFVVFAMDNRGTPRHNAEYAHCIFGQCGQKESEDQLQAIEYLLTLPWIDKDRIGIYGWSYGGFMSLTLSTANPETFKVTVAGGPVIDWRWYEIMYGERFMGRYSENPERFEATSLIPKAAKLKGRKTLIIEGGMDDVVVPVHALSFIQAASDAGVQIDYFTYPKAGHNMRNRDRANLADKVADYFIENL